MKWGDYTLLGKEILMLSIETCAICSRIYSKNYITKYNIFTKNLEYYAGLCLH